MTKLLTLNIKSIPKLPRHAKLRFDNARKKWIINAPERVFELDDIAAEVMQLVNNEYSIEDIVASLLKKFKDADKQEVSHDVISMLQNLADKGFIVV